MDARMDVYHADVGELSRWPGQCRANLQSSWSFCRSPMSKVFQPGIAILKSELTSARYLNYALASAHVGSLSLYPYHSFWFLLTPMPVFHTQIQLILESTYKLKTTGCHDNFVAARNLLAQ